MMALKILIKNFLYNLGICILSKYSQYNRQTKYRWWTCLYWQSRAWSKIL